MKPLIVYIGSFSFPKGDAVGKRAYGLGLTFRASGYDVAFIGENKEVPYNAISQDYEYDGFTFCNLRKPSGAIEHYRYINELKLVKRRILLWKNKRQIAAVVFCGTRCSLFANGLVNFCKKNNIKVISDSMDWLTWHTGNIVFDIIKNADVGFELKYVNMRTDGVICISKYLSNYYSERGKKTVIIPPVSIYSKIANNRMAQTGIITFVYAGFPCRMDRKLKDPSESKDRLDCAIELLYKAHQEGYNYKFRIIGPSLEQYLIAFPEQSSMLSELYKTGKIVFEGKQNEDYVCNAIMDADYVLVLRDRNRATMAGFSTKIAESIALGTPVITTDTSDIKNYLSDDVCYFIDLHNLSEAGEILRRILSSDVTKRAREKVLCLKNDSFEPEKYTEAFKSFIKRCENEDKI